MLLINQLVVVFFFQFFYFLLTSEKSLDVMVMTIKSSWPDSSLLLTAEIELQCVLRCCPQIYLLR